MNIINLIPYLLNKITKVEKSVGNIDFSSLQAKSEKDQVNGYLGLDANSNYSIEKLGMINEFIKFNSLADVSDRNSTNITETGNSGTSFNSSGNSYLTTDTFVQRPTITISANQLNVGRYFYFISSNRCNSPYSLVFEAVITADTNSSILNHDMVLGIGSANSIITSGNANATYGLYFTRNPTINSGRWKVTKISNGVFTTVNTSVNYQGDKTPILTKIVYDKATEIAYFYLNNELVYTMVNVNLPNTTIFYPFFNYYQNLTSDTFAKTFSLLSLKFGIKKNG